MLNQKSRQSKPRKSRNACTITNLYFVNWRRIFLFSWTFVWGVQYVKYGSQFALQRAGYFYLNTVRLNFAEFDTFWLQLLIQNDMHVNGNYIPVSSFCQWNHFWKAKKSTSEASFHSRFHFIEFLSWASQFSQALATG